MRQLNIDAVVMETILEYSMRVRELYSRYRALNLDLIDGDWSEKAEEKINRITHIICEEAHVLADLTFRAMEPSQDKLVSVDSA